MVMHMYVCTCVEKWGEVRGLSSKVSIFGEPCWKQIVSHYVHLIFPLPLRIDC